MWYDDLLGIPFAEKGRGLDGFDCWGLVQYVYARELKIQLPGYEWIYQNTITDCRDISAAVLNQSAEHWQKVEQKDAQQFDVIIMRMRGLPMHVGIVTRAGRMLHCIDGIGVSHESYVNVRWQNRILGFVRHGS